MILCFYFLFLALIASYIFIVYYEKNKCSKSVCKKSECPDCPSKNEMCSTFNTIDPKYCLKPPVIPMGLNKHTNICKPLYRVDPDCKDDTCKEDLCDDDTKACALELILGGGVHMTMAYICNCDNKSTLINDVIDYIKNNWDPSQPTEKLVVDIVLGNMMSGWFQENSRCVLGDLATIKSMVMTYLNTKTKYCVTHGVWGGTPHTEVLYYSGEKCRTPNKTIDVLDSKSWIIQ